MLTLPGPVEWTRGVRWSGQELDCSPMAIPRPNHAGRKKKIFFFFLEPPLNAQRSPDCGPEKRIIVCAKNFKLQKISSCQQVIAVCANLGILGREPGTSI